MAVTVVDAPRGFPGRPGIQPEEPGGGSAALAAEGAPRATYALSGLERARLFREAFARHGIAPGERARENLGLLEEDETRLAITGQQPGFLTGPIYTFLKAVSAIAAARHLEAVTGFRHVPVFWIAGEDHDIDEARSARFPGPGDTTVEFSLPHPSERRPLSELPFDRASEEILERALRHLEHHRFGAEARALADLCRGRSLSGGFAALLAKLFERQGLLCIEPEPLRPFAKALFRQCLEAPFDLLARIEEGLREVQSRGEKPQVPCRFPVFFIEDGKRHHLAPVEGPGSGGSARFALEGTGRSFAAQELLEILEEQPGRFSAGVLLRPAVQNALLPNPVYLGGPAEVAYFRQLRPVFEWLGLPEPGIAPRLSATFIEGKVARALRRLGLWPAGRAGRKRLIEARRPEDLIPVRPDDPAGTFQEVAGLARGRLGKALQDHRIPEEPRRRLAGAVEKVAAEIGRLGERASQAIRMAGEEDLGAARKVWTHFFPDGMLQERRWNIFHYIAKYRSDWIDDFVRAVEGDPFRPGHRWIFFPPGAEEAGA